MSKEIDHVITSSENIKEIFLKLNDIARTNNTVAKYVPLLQFLIKIKYSHMGVTDLLDKRKIKGTFRDMLKFDETFKKFAEFDTAGDRFVVSRKDFRDVLELYKDEENAFLYLDPPYIGSKTNQYAEYHLTTKKKHFLLKDIEYIKKFMDECKCKVMLSIDYTGYTREEFSKFYKTCYKKNYRCNTASGRKTYPKYHLILCNY